MATINYNLGNINVSFFPTNASSIWFCDKNTGGINIGTNGASMLTNTLQLGNSGTTTILSGTVKAESIQPITSTLSIGTSGQSTVNIRGTVNLCDGGGNLAVGNLTGTTSLNSLTTTVGGTLKANTLNSGSATTTINIADDQTTGTLNLGNLNGRAQNIHIGRYNTADICIGDLATGAGTKTIYIGMNGASKTYLRNTDLFLNDMGGTVNVGGSGSTTYMNGQVNVSIINSAGVGTRLDLGSSQTSGILTIGDSAARTGGIYIGNNIAGDIFIGDGQRSGFIYCGSSSTTASYFRGYSLNMGDTTTIGNITMGSGQTSGSITIGNRAARTGAIEIGNAGLGSNGYISIGAGGNHLNSYVQLGSGSSYTYLRGNPLLLNHDGGTTNITTYSGQVNVGNSGGAVSITGSTIKQMVPCLGGGTVVNTFGNADNATSLSTTYCRKSTSTLTALACYTLLGPGIYNCGYFEIVISGSNQYGGGYSYKGFFGLTQTDATLVTATAVSTLFSVGLVPTITFTGTNPITLNINTALGNISQSQTFIATLIAYPTITINNELYDFTVTAV
jgi:hypothetical protein